MGGGGGWCVGWFGFDGSGKASDAGKVIESREDGKTSDERDRGRQSESTGGGSFLFRDTSREILVEVQEV